jgi:radical SAM superfamily enzyme YgiQ (UPF0313 family)
MSEIAIVRVRSSQDLAWKLPTGLEPLLRLTRQDAMLERISRGAGQSYMPQLILPYLAGMGHAYNKQHHQQHNFTLIDQPEHKVDLTGFDLVLFSASTTNALATYRVSDRLRRRSIPTVLGGIHPTIMPREAADHATAIATGEAEDTLFGILGDFDAGRPLQPVYKGGRRTRLERLPLPRWQDAEVEDYAPWIVPVQTSRGCHNACNFCSTTRTQGNRRRHRPVEEIVREVRTLQQQGVITPQKTVFFTDNNIVYDADHRRGVRDATYSRELFRALRPLGIHWAGQGEIGVADDPELVDLMAQSGCFLLLVGLESVTQTSIEGTGKRCNTVDFYERSITTLHRHGISLIGCFIMGLDGDGPESFETTRQFIDEWIDVPQLSVMTPYPGTRLYSQLKREGRLLHEDWSRYDLTHVVYHPNRMSAPELAERFNDLNRDLYSYPKMIKRALRTATRRTVNGKPDVSFMLRLTSVLMPNIVYRGLAHIGMTEREQLARSGEGGHRWAGSTPMQVVPAQEPSVADPDHEPPITSNRDRVGSGPRAAS